MDTGRLAALDRLRGFLVLLVVLHHTVLAYCTFDHIDHRHYVLSTAPVVDGARWAGFDALVTINDAYFMSLLFLLSGLFLKDGLRRKGAWGYLRGRLLRLGLPFVLVELTLMPLAYYPSWLQAGGAPGIGAFWLRTVTAGPWPSGPPWFIGVLLLFDAVAAGLFAVTGRATAGAMRTPGPLLCFSLLLAALLAAYLPLLAVFGPALWIGLGPTAVQASRIGLYATSFAAGALFEARRLRSGAPSLLDALDRAWPGWVALALLAGVALLVSGPARTQLHGAALATFCAAACFALLAVFVRFTRRPSLAWQALAASSYGLYLVHYPLVTWTQYGLLSVPMDAIGKAAVTFAVALAAGWGGVALLRRVPRVRSVL